MAADRLHTRCMSQTEYFLSPISESDAEALRAGGGPAYTADEAPGYPCRRCLKDAEVGDDLILVSHDPFGSQSKYRSASPIFLHRRSCTPDPGVGELPAQLTRRRLSVRSFDQSEMMIDAAVIDGQDLEETILGFFGESQSHRIHVHNAERGCWAVNVDRVRSLT